MLNKLVANCFHLYKIQIYLLIFGVQYFKVPLARYFLWELSNLTDISNQLIQQRYSPHSNNFLVFFRSSLILPHKYIHEIPQVLTINLSRNILEMRRHLAFSSMHVNYYFSYVILYLHLSGSFTWDDHPAKISM